MTLSSWFHSHTVKGVEPTGKFEESEIELENYFQPFCLSFSPTDRCES